MRQNTLIISIIITILSFLSLTLSLSHSLLLFFTLPIELQHYNNHFFSLFLSKHNPHLDPVCATLLLCNHRSCATHLSNTH